MLIIIISILHNSVSTVCIVLICILLAYQHNSKRRHALKRIEIENGGTMQSNATQISKMTDKTNTAGSTKSSR